MFTALFTGKLVRLAAPLPEDRESFVVWSQRDDYMRLLDDDPVRPLAHGSFDSFGSAPNDHSYYFHLRTLDGDKLIGFVVLFNTKWASGSAEMAVGIGEPAYRGHGYGSDALGLILNYAFSELNLFRVGLSVMDYNTAAIKAYERAGFVLEGRRRQMVLREGQRFDLLLYGITRDEWMQR